MKKLVSAALVAALALVCAATSFAGVKRSYPVVVDYTFGYAAGSVGDARSSADTRQQIGCSVSSSSTTGMNCYATNAQGSIATCYSYSPELVKAAQSVNGDSYLFFYFDAAGVCTQLIVGNASDLRPKTL